LKLPGGFVEQKFQKLSARTAPVFLLRRMSFPATVILAKYVPDKMQAGAGIGVHQDAVSRRAQL
jgi:hypothetical protein